VHRFQDVRELTTRASVIRCLGLVYEGSPFSAKTEELYVIRWRAVKPSLFRRPLGGIDEWSMGIIPGGWVIEKAPFPGSGYAPGEGPVIPVFKIESQRLPHGAELYRIAADGRETRVAGYDADLRRWTVRLAGAAGGRAWPSGTVSTRAGAAPSTRRARTATGSGSTPRGRPAVSSRSPPAATSRWCPCRRWRASTT